MGFGFRALGVWLRVQGFKVQGFRVQGFRMLAQGLGWRLSLLRTPKHCKALVLGFGFWEVVALFMPFKAFMRLIHN